MQAESPTSEQRQGSVAMTLTPICEEHQSLPSSAIAWSAPASSGTTWNDRSSSCRNDTPRYPTAEIITDVGGGLNWKRRGLVTLLERLHRGDKLRIVVAHRDRLARFGFEVIQWMAERNGGELVVLDNRDHSPQQELTQDILAILHTFSCRLHGLRRYRQAIQADSSLSDSPAEADPPALV